MERLDIFLQCWGGVFYLLAKIFLSLAEGIEKSKYRTYGWISYLVGVPAWVVILSLNQNWIAMSIEAGGVPSMILGLMTHKPVWIKETVKWFTFTLIFSGIAYSFYVFGGITTLKQVLELGVTAGFLIGTFLLAQKNPSGWIWFVLMNTSMGTLMAMQEKWIFVFLQAISLGFVIYGFLRSRRTSLQKKTY